MVSTRGQRRRAWRRLAHRLTDCGEKSVRGAHVWTAAPPGSLRPSPVRPPGREASNTGLSERVRARSVGDDASILPLQTLGPQ
jgi:hypothetical protein